MESGFVRSCKKDEGTFFFVEKVRQDSCVEVAVKQTLEAKDYDRCGGGNEQIEEKKCVFCQLEEELRR